MNCEGGIVTIPVRGVGWQVWWFMDFTKDVAAVAQIEVVPTILDLICRTTGMGYAAVARVTEDRWVACAVRDDVAFGLKAGEELAIERTFCDTVRRCGEPVVFDSASSDPVYSVHPLPAAYGIESYISMPIVMPDGRFFGTLCGIGVKPARVRNPETMGAIRLFAGLIGMHLDTLERTAAAEARLQEERRDAEERDRFIAILGHDLRNPLAAMASATRMLQSARHEQDAPRIANMMFATIGRMSGLVENVLDFARAKMGAGVTIDPQPAGHLEQALRHVVDEMHARAPERDIRLSFDLAVPLVLDVPRVTQVFANMLSNALRHGAEDTVVRVSARSDANGFALAVANAGPPIPPAIRERLFRPFSRGEARPGQEGLGLGLYIVSEIARAHGGTVELSTDAHETCFTFRLPAAQMKGRPG